MTPVKTVTVLRHTLGCPALQSQPCDCQPTEETQVKGCLHCGEPLTGRNRSYAPGHRPDPVYMNQDRWVLERQPWVIRP